jgi:hypothetical protein
MIIQVDAVRPFADGICFDDMMGLSIETRNLLARSGVVYCTEFRTGGHVYCGSIIAPSWEQADLVAFGRGLGEKVIGKLVMTGLVE